MTQTPHATEPTAPAALAPAPIAAAVVVALLGPVLWAGCYRFLGGAVWIPPLLIGLGVGLAIRFLAPRNDSRLSVLAAVLTVLSCVAGYVVTDVALVVWVDPSYRPTLGDALTRFVNDYFVLILVAVGAYLSYVVSSKGA